MEPLVKGIPGNIHQGFDHRHEAERAYIVAIALGAVHILPRRGDTSQTPTSAIPTPDTVMNAFANTSDEFLGAKWHVVFKGLRPGVYPAW